MTTCTTDVKLTTRVGRAARKWPALALTIAVAFVGVGSVHAAGNAKDGSVKARACQVCHGKGGNSTKEAYPILAGQHAAYLRKQLQAFRDGSRKDPIMNGMAASLNDQDIEDISIYFNNIK